MAINFQTNKCAYYNDANFLDVQSSISWVGWFSLNSISVGNRQYLWTHYGATNLMGFRKDNGTPELFRWVVTSGGVTVGVNDPTGAPVAATPYHMAGTWTKAATNGIKLYRNGALVVQANTTTQTADYDSGGSVDLCLSAVRPSVGYGIATLEGFALWTGVALDANQIAALYWAGWPHLCDVPKPAVFYTMHGPVSRIPDWSGNGRHIEVATIETGIALAATMGKWEAPDTESGMYSIPPAAAGPPDPNPWILWATKTHPTATSTLTGLGNGTTYEMKVNAIDTTGNTSGDSSIVEATPVAAIVTYTHTPKDVWIGH